MPCLATIINLNKPIYMTIETMPKECPHTSFVLRSLRADVIVSSICSLSQERVKVVVIEKPAKLAKTWVQAWSTWSLDPSFFLPWLLCTGSRVASLSSMLSVFVVD